ncbi:MAG TPA: DUF6131 family protein [Pseudonocardia sp.]|nr:DUF6131 family protein [Pseudonocardia sp.]
MIVLGIILLVLGYLLGIGILQTLGMILLVVGVVLLILGAVGRPLAGRRHWY